MNDIDSPKLEGRRPSGPKVGGASTPAPPPPPRFPGLWWEVMGGGGRWDTATSESQECGETQQRWGAAAAGQGIGGTQQPSSVSDCRCLSSCCRRRRRRSQPGRWDRTPPAVSPEEVGDFALTGEENARPVTAATGNTPPPPPPPPPPSRTRSAGRPAGRREDGSGADSRAELWDFSAGVICSMGEREGDLQLSSRFGQEVGNHSPFFFKRQSTPSALSKLSRARNANVPKKNIRFNEAFQRKLDNQMSSA